MRFDLLTIFPDFFASPLRHGVVARAVQSERIAVAVHNLRDYTHDPHRTTDDRPFGGGEGMVMKPEPIAACLEAILGPPPRDPARTGVVLLSAQGALFDQARARDFAALDRLVLICGRYEGVDERVAATLADAELSIGDYVLSGGELAAAVVLDATARLLPGVLGHADSSRNESFSAAPGGELLLDCPHFTRPVDWRGLTVPAVLRDGDHAAIRRWRRKEALRKTRRLRPDLWARFQPQGDDLRLVAELDAEPPGGTGC